MQVLGPNNNESIACRWGVAAGETFDAGFFVHCICCLWHISPVLTRRTEPPT